MENGANFPAFPALSEWARPVPRARGKGTGIPRKLPAAWRGSLQDIGERERQKEQGM